MLAVKTLVPKSIISRRSLRLMGDRFEISVVGNNPGWADDRIDEAIAEIVRVEKLLSTFSDDSSINEINRNAGVSPVKADPEIFRLIDRAIQISELTFGAFDLTYYAPAKDHVSLPDTPIVKAAAKNKLNYKNIVLNAGDNTVFLTEPGMRIGFGANCKGYAADRAKYILQMNGVASGVINAGGDLLTWGLQPGNEPWTVGAADPAQRSLPFANLEISNMAIATSFNTDKHTASISKKHPGNPSTGKGFSLSGTRSVTILSPTAELSDSMATPVMMIGINAGLYMVNQLNQIACVIIDDQERMYTSKGINIAN